MTKPELLKALADKNITPPDGASAADLQKLLDEANGKPETTKEVPKGLVAVRVVGQPVCEDGVHYVKGDEIQTTPERAAALGSLVEKVG